MNRLPSWTTDNQHSTPSPFHSGVPYSSGGPIVGASFGEASSEETANCHQQRRSFPHFVYSPVHYEANYAYPLVVWLHGRSGDERQITRVMPDLSTRNYIAAAPRGNVTVKSEPTQLGQPSHVGNSASGFDWVDSNRGAEQALERVLDSVASAKAQLNVAADRIFLAGYQSGGTMATRIALRYPELFAGVANIGGTFPEGDQPLQNLDAARRHQLLMMYGEKSPIYGADDVCADLPLFHAAGLKIMMRQYPGDGELTTQMLRDLDVWIMERVTGQVTESAPTEPGTTGHWN
jgi:phospholipase/carboxylesterase